MRIPHPDGRVGHAELQIGDSRIMLADEFPEIGARSPMSLGGTPVGIQLYVDDVDAVAARALAAGAKMLRPVKDQFYGDRSGTLNDPFGHQWTISTHKEDVSLEEMAEARGGRRRQPVVIRHTGVQRPTSSLLNLCYIKRVAGKTMPQSRRAVAQAGKSTPQSIGETERSALGAPLSS